MTREVFDQITNAETRLRESGDSQKIRDLEFRMPNEADLNGIFQTELVTVKGTDTVDLQLQGHGEPFIATISRRTLLSDQVTLAPGKVRSAIDRLIKRATSDSSSAAHRSVGRTRY